MVDADMKHWTRSVLFATTLAGCTHPSSQAPQVVSEPPTTVAQGQGAMTAAPLVAPANNPVALGTSDAATPVVPPVAQTVASPPGPTAPSDRPLYYTRAITPADLEGRTLRELAL